MGEIGEDAMEDSAIPEEQHKLDYEPCRHTEGFINNLCIYCGLNNKN